MFFSAADEMEEKIENVCRTTKLPEFKPVVREPNKLCEKPMKTTSKKAFVAMMAALLVGVAFVGVAAADTKIGVDTTGLDNLWTNSTGYEKYWTLKGQDIEIPFSVTGTENDKYLAGYVVTFDGNLTDNTLTGSTAKYGNASTVWNDGSLAINGKTIAKAVDAGDVLAITNGNRTFKVAVAAISPSGSADPTTGLYKMYGVKLINLGSNFSTTEKNVGEMTSYTDLPAAVTATLDTNEGFFSNNEFVIAVRDHINNTKFAFPDYATTISDVTTPGTVYLYLEHELGQDPAKQVDVNATLNHNFDSAYDTNTWSIENNVDNAFAIVSQGTQGSDMKVLSNVLTVQNGVSLTGAESKTGTLNLTINKAISAASNTTKVSLNLSNWNTAYTNNSAATFSSYNDAQKWSFITPLKADYTIRAGPVDTTTAWNTSVLFKNITVQGHSDVQWTPNVTIQNIPSSTEYKINNLANVDGTKQLTSGQYFNVSANTVNDGTKTLTIELTGHTLGDANIDNKVDIVDSSVVGVTVLKDQNGVNYGFLPAENRLYADCGSSSPDGEITVGDILAINKYLVGANPWAA